MKYGVNTMVWTTRMNRESEALLSRIKQWGFDGVELFLGLNEPANIREMSQILDRIGLDRTTCAVLPRDANLVSTDADVRARGVDFLKQYIERTSELGGQLICGPLYAALGVMTGKRRTDEEWKWAADGLATASRRGEELDVVLCIEPLNRFETYFLNTQADAAKLVRSIGAPNLKIHFDTFHANVEERNPVNSLRSIAPVLGHVHISENDRGTPGTGHTDWKGVFSALKDIGYDGWLTIESFAQPEPDLAAAAAIWRDLVSSGDELACNGLQFMKQMSRETGLRPA